MITPKLPVILTEADWKKRKGKLSALAGGTTVSQLMLAVKTLFEEVKWSAFDVSQALRPTDTAEQIEAQLLLAKAEYKKVPPLVKKLEALEFQAAVARNHFAKNKLIPKASVLHADQVSKAAKLLATQAEMVQAEFAAFEAAAAGKRPAPTTAPTTTPSPSQKQPVRKPKVTAPRTVKTVKPKPRPRSNSAPPKLVSPKPSPLTQPQKVKPLTTPPVSRLTEAQRSKPLPQVPPKKTVTTSPPEQQKRKPLPQVPPKKTAPTGQPPEQRKRKPLPTPPPKKTAPTEDSQPESESQTGT